MRLLRLELKNFIAYRRPVEVDFSKALRDHRLLLITGPTGSGKSTLMDGILYALFGVGRRKKTLRPPISQFSPHEPSRVAIEFALDHDTFRIEREWISRGEDWGEAMKRWLKRKGDEWIDVDPSIILKRFTLLEDFELFRRVVVIPQGEYSHFIDSQPKERYALLERFLPLEWVERFGEVLKEMLNEAEKEKEILSDRIAMLLKLEEGPEDPLDTLPIIQERQKEVEGVREGLVRERKGLEGEERLLNDLRKDVERKERLKEVLRDLRDATERLLDLKREEGRIVELRGICNRLEEFVERFQGDYITIKDLDRRIGEGERERDRLLKKLKAIEEDYSKIEEEVKRLPQYRKEKEDLKERLKAAIEKVEGLKRLGEALKACMDLRKEAEEKEAFLKAYEGILHVAQQKELKEEKEAIEKEMEELEKRRKGLEEREVHLEGLYRDALLKALSEDLEPGRPCPVCGSTHHPSPFRPCGEDLSIEAITEERTRISKELQALKKKQGELEERLKGVEERFKALPSGLPDYDRLKEDLLRIGMPVDEDPGRTLEEWERRGLYLEEVKSDYEDLCKEILKKEAEVVTRRENLQGTLEVSSPEAVEERIRAARKEEEVLREREKDLERKINDLEERDRRLQEGINRVKGELRNQEERLSEDSRKLHGLKGNLERSLKGARYHRTLRDLEASMKDLPRLREVREGIDRWERELTAELNRYNKALESLRSLTDRSWEDLLSAAKGAGTPEGIRSTLEEVNSRLLQVEGEIRVKREDLERREEALKRRREDLGRKESEVQNVERSLSDALEGVKEWRSKRSRFLALKVLKDHLSRAEFSYWVARIYIHRTLGHAGSYLEEFSDGRYTFYYISPDDRGLEILVEDRFTGERRDARHLSGGEKFMASLALALGMAHTLVEARGSEAPGFIFLDEGFGTLDRETLSRVAQILRHHARRQDLDLLVISHRTELKDYFPVTLEVIPSCEGSSIKLNLP